MSAGVSARGEGVRSPIRRVPATCVALLVALSTASSAAAPSAMAAGTPPPAGPVLAWNTFLGSATADYGEAVAVDGDGNLYVAGRSGAAWGDPILPFTLFDDAFVAKLSPGGALHWHTFLGPADNYAGATGIAVDGDANVYVVGGAFAPWGAPLQAMAGVYDTFVAKLDVSGTLQWHTFLGSYQSGSTPTGQVGHALAADGSGNVFVAGRSYASWGAEPVRPFGGSSDAFVAKLSTAGELQWNTFLGSAGFDYASGIALGAGGDIYVTGSSSATWGAPVRAHAGQSDTFAAKLSTAGDLQWNTFLGSADWEQPGGIAVGAGGEVFVTGEASATWGAPKREFSGYVDAYVAKLAGDGALAWNTFLGSEGDDRGRAVAAAGSGGVCVVGDSDAAWGDPAPAHGGLLDGFVALLDAAGQLQWHTFLGGSDNDNARGVVIAGNGAIAVAGKSSATWGSPVNSFAGTFDALVAVLPGTDAPLLLADSFSDGTAAGDPHWQTLSGRWLVGADRTFASGSLSAANRSVVRVLPGFGAGRISTRLRLTPGALARGAGILFALKDVRHYRYVVIRGSQIVLGQEGDTSRESAGVKKLAAQAFRADLWYRLRVDVYPGGRVSVYLGKAPRLVLTYRFADTPAGRIGCLAKQSVARFDDYTVWDARALP